MELNMMDQDGNHLPVVITEVRETTIVLDGNHPLAGKDLTFEIELVEINA
jgi:peptidylprolyl isomerase